MKKLKQKQQLTQQLQERQKQHQSSALLEANRLSKESLQPQLQSGVNKPSQKIQVPRSPGRESMAAAHKKWEDLKALCSRQTKVGFQMGTSEHSAKKVKLEKTTSDNKGQVRSTPRPAKPKDLVREDLNEDFWKKLAAEEAVRKSCYPHQVVQSPWQKGDSAAPKFKFTRPAAAANKVKEERGADTVKSNKRKLYSKSSVGPEEF